MIENIKPLRTKLENNQMENAENINWMGPMNTPNLADFISSFNLQADVFSILYEYEWMLHIILYATNYPIIRTEWKMEKEDHHHLAGQIR